MNAVNLIPLERRRTEVPSLPGAPFLGLLAALVVALVGTFLYVGAHNRVSARQGELSHLRAGTAEWSAAAAKYAPAVADVKQHTQRFAELGTLLGQRADWSLLLGQLAGVMPAHAQLSSLSATAPTPAASSATSGAASTTSSDTSTSSGITISGCAGSQAVVADTMLALRRLSGVSAVNLSSSAQVGGQASSDSSSGAGACTLPVQFSLSLQFSPVVGLGELLDGAGSASSTSTTAQTASTSDPTGVAQ